MSDLTALIARVEAATGPDREIDADIARAVGYIQSESHSNHWISPEDQERKKAWGCWGSNIDPPAFTESIDAALTLVPDGVDGTPMNAGFGIVNDGGGIVKGLASVSDSLREPCFTGLAETPALALCAAALKARQP